jgi:hypothetical protein
MQRKNSRREQSARHAQPGQHPPQRQRRGRMQRDIDEVITQRLKFPKLEFDPIDGVGERPVVEIFAGLPDSEQPAGFEHWIVQKMLIVVPEKPAVPRRHVDEKNRRHQRGSDEPLYSSKKFRRRNGVAVAARTARRRRGTRRNSGLRSRRRLLLALGSAPRTVFLRTSSHR